MEYKQGEGNDINVDLEVENVSIPSCHNIVLSKCEITRLTKTSSLSFGLPFANKIETCGWGCGKSSLTRATATRESLSTMVLH